MNNEVNLYPKGKIIRFLIAQGVSLAGSALVQYAVIWYITLSTSSGSMIMISTICAFLPQIAISFFAGVWLDKYNRKTIIILADGAIALATLCAALLFLSGYKNIWILFIVLAVRSAGTGVQMPAVNAFIAQITPKDYLMRVNGVNSTINSVIMFVSPAVSAAILAAYPIESIFFIDVFTALIGIGVMFTIAAPAYKRKEAATNTLMQDMKQGFIYLKENRFIRNLIGYQFFLLVLITPCAFLTPLLISRTFGMEVWRLSVTEMTYSAGTLLGGLAISLFWAPKKRVATILLTGIIYASCMIAMGVCGLFWVFLIFNFIIGVTLPYYNTPITVLVQERAARHMHGRVFSIMQIAVCSSFPAGMLAFGPLADILSVQSLFISCGALVICYVVFTARAVFRKTLNI